MNSSDTVSLLFLCAFITHEWWFTAVLVGLLAASILVLWFRDIRSGLFFSAKEKNVDKKIRSNVDSQERDGDQNEST